MITAIHCSGFRSLKEFSWNLAPLNVLIGPNGAGKSNILSLFELFSALAEGDARDFVLRLGGMDAVSWGVGREAIRLGVDPQWPGSDFKYRCTLHSMDGATPVIVDESLTRGAETLFSYQPGEFLVEGKKIELDEEDVSTTRLSQLHGTLLPRIRSFNLVRQLRAWRVYRNVRLDAEATIRRPSLARSDKFVEPDGQNLVSVIHTHYSTNDEFRAQIDSALTAAFPDDYRELVFPPVADGRLHLHVKRAHSRRKDSIAELSDGTLQFLFLVTLFCTPQKPPLIAIDEPERSLHPAMLAIIAEMAAEASRSCQVILATQSPTLLDAFSETHRPSVSAVRWACDRSEMRTMEGAALERWLKDYSLGKFAFSGEAEAVLF